MVSFKQTLLFSIIFSLLLTKGLSRRGGFLQFQFLCYQNPGHFDYQGQTCDSIPSKNCDPFFIICISNKPIKEESPANCPVYHKETEPYFNEETVCNTPYDNRGDLGKNQIFELPYPLQETYYVRIVVKDYNKFSAHQYIAVFSAVYNGKASSNFNDFPNTVLSMNREERLVYNRKARLKISIGLKCDRDLYGDLCVTFCRASKSDTYTCAANGKKICKAGWDGPECDKKDLCYNFPCASEAICIKILNLPKCMCNGNVAPECYPNYNPCQPNPCQNGGQCVQENYRKDGITCICKNMYHGVRCQMKFDLCQIDPCLNNGTCAYLKNGTRICKCLPDFKGVLCDYPSDPVDSNKWNITNNVTSSVISFDKMGINYGILFGVLFGLCVLIMVLVGIFFLLTMSRRKTTVSNTSNTIYLKDLTRTTVPVPTHTEYDTYTTETQYDTIEDRSTYIYIQNNNDDYLEPNNGNPSAKSPTTVSNSSDYIPMFNNDNLYIPEHATATIDNRNEELPPLPSRNVKEKKKKLFCGLKL